MASILPEFDTPNSKPLLALVDEWAVLFGYHTNRIDLKTGDLSAVCLPDCTLTAHAPLWGTKPGKEKGVPAGQVRKTLAGSLLPFVQIARHNMHVAMHPQGKGLCIFFEVRGKLKVAPAAPPPLPLPHSLCRSPLLFLSLTSLSPPPALSLSLLTHTLQSTGSRFLVLTDLSSKRRWYC